MEAHVLQCLWNSGHDHKEDDPCWEAPGASMKDGVGIMLRWTWLPLFLWQAHISSLIILQRPCPPPTSRAPILAAAPSAAAIVAVTIGAWL